MPSSSLFLGSSTTLVSLLSLISAPIAANPLTYSTPGATYEGVGVGWDGWSTSTKPADPTWSDWKSTKTPDPTWSDWKSTKTTDPWSDWKSTSTKPADPWSDWKSTTKSYDPWNDRKSTSTKPADPWSDWKSTTTKPADPWTDWDPKTKTTNKPVTGTAWNDWSGNGKDGNSGKGFVTTITTSSCTTPKPSVGSACWTWPLDNAAKSSTSCTTYHVESEGYKVTSSCTTVPIVGGAITSTCKTTTTTPAPVCSTSSKVVTVTIVTTSSCTTPAAKPTTTCLTRLVDGGKPKSSSSCTTWHVETAGYPITSSCTTFPLVGGAITSDCSTVTPKATPVCSYGVTTSTVGDNKAGWTDWSDSTKGTPAKDTTSTPVKATTCVTPSASTSTSCTTYHLESEGYKVTSSCSTVVVTPSVTCTAGGWSDWDATGTPVKATSSASASASASWSSWDGKSPAATTAASTTGLPGGIKTYDPKNAAGQVTVEKVGIAMAALVAAGALML